MNIAFKRPDMEDRDIMRNYLKREHLFGCDFTLTNLLLWSEFYNVSYAIVEDSLVFRTYDDDGELFSYPIGASDMKASMDRMIRERKDENKKLRLYHITSSMRERIEAAYPEGFRFYENRDNYDYIYNTSDLIELAGKKYHGKRNHINKFMENNWSYEVMNENNKNECLEMSHQWCRINECAESETKQAEYEVVQNSIRLFRELDLCGGLIRVDGEVVAFSLGEPINEEMFVVHIEKAFADIQGSYPMINREFARHEAVKYRYINREEDMGIEGLRKAKLSYRPAFLLEKFDAEYTM